MRSQSRSWIRTGLVMIAVAIAVVFTFIQGLYVYMTATAKPLHPNPQAVQSVAHSAPVPKWAAAVEQGRQIARRGVIAQNLPGLSVAVGVGDDIVWAEGFGWADLEKQVRVTPDTRFRTGDVSKALTSAAVGRLLEKGRLNLDADIQTYVPDFPEKQWPVTVRQLMGQVAGFRDDPGDEASMEPCARTVDGLQLFADDALLFEPGSRYRASS
jgi:serine beta-lactamase-like protein LACTB, mitochondrial